MLNHNFCPRCHGFLFLKNEVGGKYASCLQCGYEKEIRFDKNPPDKSTDSQKWHFNPA